MLGVLVDDNGLVVIEVDVEDVGVLARRPVSVCSSTTARGGPEHRVHSV
ncbi:MAG: hypothetical protein KY439_01155 [Actinobacteria bacterium]|nr:hypothetical protein [Actinomycetota bacterium]